MMKAPFGGAGFARLGPVEKGLGVLANGLGIVGPLLPEASVWVTVGSLGALAAFWVWVVVSRWRSGAGWDIAVPGPSPRWNSERALAAVEKRGGRVGLCALVQRHRPHLCELEQAALVLLKADLLETGGWSKTQVYRFTAGKKALSAVGSLSGSSLAAAAVEAYGYGETELGRRLSRNLKLLLADNGRVKQGYSLTGTTVRELQYENLRHTAGWALVVSSLASRPAYVNGVAGILADGLEERLGANRKAGAVEDKDLLGLTLATLALVQMLPELPPNQRYWCTAQCQKALGYISSLVELGSPGHLAWGTQGGGETTAATVPHWFSAWTLGRLLGWSGMAQDTRTLIRRRLVELLERSIDDGAGAELLPYGYTPHPPQVAVGRSLLSTGLAIDLGLRLAATAEPNELERLAHGVGVLVAGMAEMGLECAHKDALEPPYEGFLGWAATLIALRALLHPDGTGPSFDARAVLEPSGSARLERAIAQVNAMWSDAGVRMNQQGLLRDI